MRVRLLVGHYCESYPGQHAPTVFGAVDEFVLDENPDWWDQHVAAEKTKAGDEVAAWAEVSLEVDTEALFAALHPEHRAIPATLIETAVTATDTRRDQCGSHDATASRPCPASTHLPAATIDADGFCTEHGWECADYRHFGTARED